MYSDDSIVLTLPDHLNNTDAVSTEIYRQIHSPQGVIGTTKRPNFVRVSFKTCFKPFRHGDQIRHGDQNFF